MLRSIRILTLLIAFAFSAIGSFAQTSKWRDVIKIKKKDTIYSICRKYGITEDQLRQANPEMQSPDYQLKKGSYICIPFADTPTGTSAPTGKQPAKAVVKQQADGRLRIGVMLPLNDKTKDGRLMTEYYRGVLMACDSLKQTGYSIDIAAWNVTDQGSTVNTALLDPHAAKCDIIIGPYYNSQVARLTEFTALNRQLLVIPFTIDAPELYTNRHIFQIYQPQNEQTANTVHRLIEWFKNYHPIIVDCADPQSTKGAFTATLRREFDVKGISYNLTSTQSATADFQRAFSTSQPNIVILNSSRTSDMNILFGKLSTLTAGNSGVKVAVFGYPEWQSNAGANITNFHRYDVYIPAPFYFNILAVPTDRFVKKYRATFHEDMQQGLPKMAVTGFDHAMYFLKGLKQYGRKFDGATAHSDYTPLQTPLKFERRGNGGLQNRAQLFIHYKPDHKVELIKY